MFLQEWTIIPSEHLVKLVELYLRSTYLEFQGQFYDKSESANMRSPLSPVIANIYMEHLEETALQTAPLQPILWLRSVDDTVLIWPHEQVELHYHDHINQQHSNIQFTVEEQKDQKLAFLVVDRSPDRLSTCAYRKPTHTDE